MAGIVVTVVIMAKPDEYVEKKINMESSSTFYDYEVRRELFVMGGGNRTHKCIRQQDPTPLVNFHNEEGRVLPAKDFIRYRQFLDTAPTANKVAYLLKVGDCSNLVPINKEAFYLLQYFIRQAALVGAIVNTALHQSMPNSKPLMPAFDLHNYELESTQK